MAKQARRDMSDTPEWPTTVMQRWADGRILGIDGAMWLYRSFPLGPVTDAKTPEASAVQAEPLMSAFEQLATMAGPVRLTRRAAAKSAYRDVHIMLISIPKLFVPNRGSVLGQFHSENFGDRHTTMRVGLLGVKLNAHGSMANWRDTVSDIADTILYGGTPNEQFDRDARLVSQGLARAGLVVPREEQMLLATSWWNQGNHPETPILPHTDHMHVFSSLRAAKAAAQQIASGSDDCGSWVGPGQHLLSFAAGSDIDLGFVGAFDPKAHWVSRIVSSGAPLVSIRGRVEPAKVTREELRRMRKTYISDINEREAAGKMSRAEQEEMLEGLTKVEQFYSSQGGATPTLVDGSIIVAFDRPVDSEGGFDPVDVGVDAGLNLRPMIDHQRQALFETMVASNVRSNPIRNDLPAQTIAYSGLPNLSVVGDADGGLAGFTEEDRQPAYISPTAATDEDSSPIFFAVGQTGAGKSVFASWLADQFCRIPTPAGEMTPVTMFDPKTGSNFSALTRRNHGHTFSLDKMLEEDGVYDPIRYCQNPMVGVDLSASMLMSINVWGSQKADAEIPILNALSYGVNTCGERSTLQALERAVEDGKIDEAFVRPVRAAAQASPMFRAVCGSKSQEHALSTSSGLTYIRVGQANLDLPTPDSDPADHTFGQKVALALIRSIAYGSVMAMAGRDGVLILDEAWVFTISGPAELDRIGRLARSQRVFPILLSQRASDVINIGLKDYISRGIILPIQSRSEAVAACQLFDLLPTESRLKRIMADKTIGSGQDTAGQEPNWNSMRALTDPVSRRTLRGTIGIYCDLHGRAAATEIVIPPDLLADISTSRLDVLAREKKLREAASRPSEVSPVGVNPARVGAGVEGDPLSDENW